MARHKMSGISNSKEAKGVIEDKKGASIQTRVMLQRMCFYYINAEFKFLEGSSFQIYTFLKSYSKIMRKVPIYDNKFYINVQVFQTFVQHLCIRVWISTAICRGATEAQYLKIYLCSFHSDMIMYTYIHFICC